MKKTILFLALISLSVFFAFPESAGGSTQNDGNRATYSFSLSGLTVEFSGFNYFSMGLGYSWGNYTVFNGHFSASAYGFMLQYNTANEMRLRFFWNLYGGMLLGASGIIATNFNETTIGIAPHIGIGVYTMNLFYRYNFHLNSGFNNHEIVLKLLRRSN